MLVLVPSIDFNFTWIVDENCRRNLNIQDLFPYQFLESTEIKAAAVVI